MTTRSTATEHPLVERRLKERTLNALELDLRDAHKEIDRLGVRLKEMERTSLKELGTVSGIYRGADDREAFEITVDTGHTDPKKLTHATMGAKVWIGSNEDAGQISKATTSEAILTLSAQLTDSQKKASDLEVQLKVAYSERDRANEKVVEAADRITALHKENAALKAELEAIQNVASEAQKPSATA
jgi:hypothetical protein